ncbi:MAG: exopolyphosphatase [Chloroherpetonaceae bacterium]|nr:exopolyphosphatase [Chloroherpetonaceae bacterium]
MRLLTRSDFDGLMCAVLLKEVIQLDSVEFHHPKDMQDGKVTVTEKDVITNLPFNSNAGLWFDHHSSESSRFDLEEVSFKGRYEVAPSAARVVYNYYVQQGHAEKFKKYDKILVDVDKADSANLTPEDVLTPKGWILLSYLMDPRTGLGKQHDYAVSNRELMFKLIDWIPEYLHNPEALLALPDVKSRVDRYTQDEKNFRTELEKHSRVEGNVVITDFRGVETPIGNRFLIYTLFPKTNISVRVMDGRKGEFCSLALGHSIFNRTSKTDVGALMAKYGGGGHRGAGTCQLPYSEVDSKLSEIVAKMKADG